MCRGKKRISKKRVEKKHYQNAQYISLDCLDRTCRVPPVYSRRRCAPAPILHHVLLLAGIQRRHRLLQYCCLRWYIYFQSPPLMKRFFLQFVCLLYCMSEIYCLFISWQLTIKKTAYRKIKKH